MADAKAEERYIAVTARDEFERGWYKTYFHDRERVDLVFSTLLDAENPLTKWFLSGMPVYAQTSQYFVAMNLLNSILVPIPILTVICGFLIIYPRLIQLRSKILAISFIAMFILSIFPSPQQRYTDRSFIGQIIQTVYGQEANLPLIERGRDYEVRNRPNFRREDRSSQGV